MFVSFIDICDFYYCSETVSFSVFSFPQIIHVNHIRTNKLRRADCSRNRWGESPPEASKKSLCWGESPEASMKSLCGWVPNSRYQPLRSCCDSDSHPWGNSLASLHSESKVEPGKQWSLVWCSIHSPYARACGVTHSKPTLHDLLQHEKVLHSGVTSGNTELQTHLLTELWPMQ